MNEEEFKECSVVAYPRQIKFLHINGGAISYYVDRHVSDYVDRLQRENQELKRKLNEAIHKATEFESEVYELKKQLEEYKNPLKGIFAQVNDDMLLRNCGAMQSVIDTYKNQQKEFIEYLEDEIKRINPKELDIGELNLRLDDIKFTQYLIYKEILQKYKSIIGGNDEK